MAQLAIKGHPTRGKEVIQLLEMLGGEDCHNLYGEKNFSYYTIENDEIKGGIYIFGDEPYKFFTLEEFEERFPYKVGNKVTLDGFPCIITGMNWDCDDVIYYVKGADFSKGVYSTDEDLQPYKEETMEERDEKPVNHVFDTDVISFDIAQKDKYELDLQGKFEVVLREGKYYVERIKPTHPKTYEECCENVFGIVHGGITVDLPMHYSPLFIHFAKLIICRDAYWKIAGEQMGLDKLWEPDWNDCAQHKFGLYTLENEIRCINLQVLKNIILVFPTTEMRDAFYENFKDLIEQCKELL